jgi:hypothetical protein
MERSLASIISFAASIGLFTGPPDADKSLPLPVSEATEIHSASVPTDSDLLFWSGELDSEEFPGEAAREKTGCERRCPRETLAARRATKPSAAVN